jgi:hypothetical protein
MHVSSPVCSFEVSVCVLFFALLFAILHSIRLLFRFSLHPHDLPTIIPHAIYSNNTTTSSRAQILKYPN